MQRAPLFTLGAWLPSIIHVSPPALTNIGKTYHTCATSFLSVFLLLFRLSIELGRLVGLMPFRYQKISFLAFPALAASWYTVDIDLVFCRFSALRIALYSILISIARLVDFQ